MTVRASSRLPPPGTRGYEVLALWTVTDHPSDFPDHYVARRSEILAGGAHRTTEVTLMDPDLEVLRGALRARGLFRLERMPGDDPVILEVWL